MSDSTHLTVGAIAAFYGVAAWQARRAVDALDTDIPRAGQYRLVPRHLLGRVAAELERRGYLQPHVEATP